LRSNIMFNKKYIVDFCRK